MSSTGVVTINNLQKGDLVLFYGKNTTSSDQNFSPSNISGGNLIKYYGSGGGWSFNCFAFIAESTTLSFQTNKTLGHYNTAIVLR